MSKRQMLLGIQNLLIKPSGIAPHRLGWHHVLID
jgi:hypothetical protein